MREHLHDESILDARQTIHITSIAWRRIILAVFLLGCSYIMWTLGLLGWWPGGSIGPTIRIALVVAALPCALPWCLFIGSIHHAGLMTEQRIRTFMKMRRVLFAIGSALLTIEAIKGGNPFGNPTNIEITGLVFLSLAMVCNLGLMWEVRRNEDVQVTIGEDAL